jgi:DNA-binding IclR family transcriptional regulator
LHDNGGMPRKPTPEPLFPPETPAQREDPDFVTAVARGFAVLRCFRRGERALGNKEMAERTGLPRSTIARLTHTLTELGYLEHVPALEKYSLGISVLSFGQTYLSGLDLREVARPYMQALADEVKGTVSLAGNAGDDMMFLELAHGNPTFALRVAVGERVPRGTSALGRAYSAGLAPQARQESLAAFKRLVKKSDWPAAERSVQAALDDYEKYGVCFSMGDWNPDVHGVSTPMVSNDGHKVVAFSASLPAHRASRDHLIKDVAPKLKAMRDRVRQALGGAF